MYLYYKALLSTEFALLQLVHFIGNHHKGTAAFQEPVGHGNVVIRGRMTVIHNENAQIDAAGGEVILHQPAPAFLFLLRNLCKAVAGQVHQIALLVDDKVVDMNGLTGLFTHSGKVLSLEQPVDNGRLTHIGLACKGDFRQPVLGKILGRWAEIKNSTF